LFSRLYELNTRSRRQQSHSEPLLVAQIRKYFHLVERAFCDRSKIKITWVVVDVGTREKDGERVFPEQEDLSMLTAALEPHAH
jgi:hypothetical protein